MPEPEDSRRDQETPEDHGRPDRPETQGFPDRPAGSQWQHPDAPGGPPRWSAHPPVEQTAQLPTSSWGPPPGPPPHLAAPPPGPPRRQAATILLAVATALFLVAAVGLGALYLAERNAHNSTKGQLSTQQTQLDGVRKELDSTKGKLTSAEKAKTDAEGRNAELQKCADAAGEFIEAVKAEDQTRGEQAVLAVLAAC